MKRNESYNTKQKDLILNTIKNQKHEFTIKDIYDKVKDSTGLTTIYRLVDKLVDEGKISKTIGNNNVTYYQYLIDCNEINHFYLKCDNCGKMDHVDCDCIDEMSSHISNEHHFKLNKKNIIINGICEKCLKKEKEYE